MPNPKKININLLDVKQSGSFTKNDWIALYDIYTIEAKDIIFTSKTKTLKDSNNAYYKWTHLSFNGIINGEQKDPKMPKNSNYATKADIKEIKDSLKNYATKDDIKAITNDIQEIKDTLILIVNSINDFKKEVNARFDRIETRLDKIESCPTIKRELNAN